MTQTNNSKGKTGLTLNKANSIATRIGFAAIGLVIGIVIGIAGALFIGHYNPKDKASGPEVLAASVVFDRVMEQDKIISASQTYSIVEKAGTANKIPFTDIPIPFTDNSFWYRYAGTIEAAVSLENALFEQKGTTIEITLDEPFLSSNTPDMSKSGVLEERNNILNPIHIEDVDTFRAQCVEASERGAREGGLLDEARQNAQSNLDGMFKAALGNAYNVEVIWRTAE